MSPSAALHNSVFRAYTGITLGVLVVAGIVLLFLQIVFRMELGSAWKTYRSWLWLAPLAALVIFAGRVPFIIGVTVVSLLGCKEFAQVSGLARDRWMTGAAYAAILFSAGGSGPLFALGSILLIPILRNRKASVVAAGGDPGRPETWPPGSPARITDPGSSELQRMSLGVVAFVYLGWMFGQLAFLANAGNAYGYLCYVIFATEVSDVAAFTFGKMFGRHPLRSRISPRKTWEGALGALGVSIALPWLLRFSFPFFGTWQLILAGLI
ncbi:MAG TPA: phosphatidate cytidylyltransferase, partial [Chthoniobacterales bacterium]|nr:phosphatidate cytidylyltransferase [Chthoniobacterales bacterium]